MRNFRWTSVPELPLTSPILGAGEPPTLSGCPGSSGRGQRGVPKHEALRAVGGAIIGDNHHPLHTCTTNAPSAMKTSVTHVYSTLPIFHLLNGASGGENGPEVTNHSLQQIQAKCMYWFLNMMTIASSHTLASSHTHSAVQSCSVICSIQARFMAVKSHIMLPALPIPSLGLEQMLSPPPITHPLFPKIQTIGSVIFPNSSNISILCTVQD